MTEPKEVLYCYHCRKCGEIDGRTHRALDVPHAIAALPAYICKCGAPILPKKQTKECEQEDDNPR